MVAIKGAAKTTCNCMPKSKVEMTGERKINKLNAAIEENKIEARSFITVRVMEFMERVTWICASKSSDKLYYVTLALYEGEYRAFIRQISRL